MNLTLRPELFWDVNIKTLDLQKHRMAIIERVVQRGRLHEFQEILKYYSKEEVKKTLLNIRYLDKITLSFCSAIFEIPKTEFRCYKLAQLNPEHWDY